MTDDAPLLLEPRAGFGIVLPDDSDACRDEAFIVADLDAFEALPDVA